MARAGKPKSWPTEGVGNYREHGLENVHEKPLGLRMVVFFERDWRVRQDLNLQPSDPKSEALSN